ncbi:sugar kinase [Chelativorans sp.]|uniref:carbohydrate kinase family protein n=1 Tax=Chelativorans sp. TaxID=2203393 RepID=UPI0028113AE9|nr:sugar kinase [Chelativorans sp.]
MTSQTSHNGAVLSLGRIYCDLVFTGVPGMPRLGREIFAENMTVALGGGAYITAAHSAALGRPTALLARYGTDALSRAMEPELALHGIDLRFLDRHPQAGPQVTVAIVGGEERAFLSRRAGSAAPATLDAALAWSQSRHLHIAEYATLVEIPDLVDRAKGRGLTVSLDPSWDETLIREPHYLDRCAGIDVFLPNMEEARVLTGKESPSEALQALASRFPIVVLKLGAEGGMLSMDGQVVSLAARKVPVVDTTGAGDALNAGFINAWLGGAEPEACLAAGIDAGAAAVQAAGGASVLTGSGQSG